MNGRRRAELIGGTDVNHGLDEGLAGGQALELGNDIGEFQAVRDPGRGVDFTFFNELHDPGKEAATVAAGLDGDFFPMEESIIDRDRLFGETDVNESAPRGNVGEARCHDRGAARGVKDGIGLATICRFGVGEAHAGDEFSTPLALFDDVDGRTDGSGKLSGSDADGTCSNHKRRLAGLQAAAADGMRADAEGFNEGKLIERERSGLIEKIDGNGEKLLHAAINVDTEDLDLLAAVGAAHTAGATDAAGNVGLDGATVARLDPAFVGRGFDDDPGELVADDARVCVDGVAAGEGVVIAATDADLPDPDERLAGRGDGERRFSFSESSRGFQYNLHHGVLSLMGRIGPAI